MASIVLVLMGANGVGGDVFQSVSVSCWAAWQRQSVSLMHGILHAIGKNLTVSPLCSALVFVSTGADRYRVVRFSGL